MSQAQQDYCNANYGPEDIPAPDNHDLMQRIFSNFVNSMMRLAPAERAEILEWVGETYCIKCGYPAPPHDVTCATCAIPNGMLQEEGK